MTLGFFTYPVEWKPTFFSMELRDNQLVSSLISNNCWDAHLINSPPIFVFSFSPSPSLEFQRMTSGFGRISPMGVRITKMSMSTFYKGIPPTGLFGRTGKGSGNSGSPRRANSAYGNYGIKCYLLVSSGDRGGSSFPADVPSAARSTTRQPTSYMNVLSLARY